MSDDRETRGHALSERSIAALLRAQFPDVEAAEVTHLGAGCDFDAYEVDRRWVFRFPKRDEYAPLLLREVTLLEEMGPRLCLPVPRYRFVGHPTKAFPRPFGGYEKLPGVPYGSGNVARGLRLRLARDLGRFLAKLHAVVGDDALRLAVYPEPEGETMRAQRSGALEELSRNRHLLSPDVMHALERTLGDERRVPAEYAGPPRLTHADLGREHILVNDAGRGITGILDWSDSGTTDPAQDFVTIWIVAGDEGLEAALDAYDLPIDDGLRDRVRYRVACLAPGEIAWWTRQGSPAHLEPLLASLRRLPCA